MIVGDYEAGVFADFYLRVLRMAYTECMDAIFPVGTSSIHPGPLARFLPPVDDGVIARILARIPEGETPLLDPFGVSPRVALETAASGRALIVAANNPVTRFVIKRTLMPFEKTTLQSALAHIAAIPKDDTRLELFILDLYRSECNRCGESVIVDYFVWDRELGGPSDKVYGCDSCGHTGETPTSEDDWIRSADYSRHGLQYALALEQVASPDDPDRTHAEAALSVYPGRAIFGLITLVNKLNQTNNAEPLASAADALLLSAFDEANALWGHPEGRARPKQLIASQKYREHNVWLALERGVEAWTMPDHDIDVMAWPASEDLAPGCVAIYPGPIREFVQTLPSLSVNTILTIPPRPNQAFWTLSALWSAWLWGREEAGSIKVALRRRRYDWSWHASALKTALVSLEPALAEGASTFAYVPEAEPGFMASVLSGFDGAGHRLHEIAYRSAERQAYFTWMMDASVPDEAPDVVRSTFESASKITLESRGEPATYATLHVAGWSKLALARALAPRLESSLRHPLTHIDEIFEDVLSDRDMFQHLGRGIEPESGQYWLVDTGETDPPLSDQVEILVLQFLRENEGIAADELEALICRELRGVLTPDGRYIRVCLQSYAEPDANLGVWRLRSEDKSDARIKDRDEIINSLRDLGAHLGYGVIGNEDIGWLDKEGAEKYRFHVMETASLGKLFTEVDDGGVLTTYVVPGGRALLVADRARRDIRIRDLIQDSSRVIKFRHVRRLEAETTLTRENFAERLLIDPPEQQDPQMPLL